MNRIIATRIINLVSNDPAKIAILKLLSDGKWHTRYELEAAAKGQRATIGIVGISVILNALKEADAELFEIYDNNSGRFFKLSPQRMVMISRIVRVLDKSSKESMTASAYQFKRFKDRLKADNKKKDDCDSLDEDLKQFL